MNIWMNGKSLIKHHCHKNMFSIVTYIWKALQIQITIIQRDSVIILKRKIWVNVISFLQAIRYTFFYKQSPRKSLIC